MTKYGKDALFDLMQEVDVDFLTQSFDSQYTLRQFIQKSTQAAYNNINEQFWNNIPIKQVLKNRALTVDRAIILSWHWHKISEFQNVTILATGGYGAEHLHPHSDVDTLILVPTHQNSKLNQQLEKMISFLWDVGFRFATSVLTLHEAQELAATDVSMFTSLLTFRFIVGDTAPLNYLQKICYENKSEIWPFEDFYQAKIKERQENHQRFKNSEYNQEPNIKESPGALRDIDFIEWLAKKCYGKNGLTALCDNHNFTEYELNILTQNKYAFWEIRYALHLLSSKPNDRVYLEYQADIAKSLNWPGRTLNESVARMMQKYFRMASQIKAISDILAQRFQEQLHPARPEACHILSPNAQLIGNYLDITQMEWYNTKPEEFISLFVTHANTYSIEGFTAKTNQALYVYFNKLPKGQLLQNSTARQYFIDLFQYPYKVGDTLSLMNRLGVLPQFIPDYAALIGQMQFDLNHIYTVDAHTLRVIQFVQAFYLESSKNDLPFVAECLKICDDALILYCAAFFHDIGKGHNGDHSKIGGEIALQFCKAFSLTNKQTKLITWLVSHHLALSRFAQSKDLSDENVILEFAEFVKNKEYFCYLYLLTAADIQGTNPKLWNSWRRALLRDLYNKTLAILNLSEFPSKPSKTSTRKKIVIESLQKEGIKEQSISDLWRSFGSNYFEMTNSQSLKWHAIEILKNPPNTSIVAIRPHWNKAGTDILVYSKDSHGLFAYICQVLEKLMLTIAEAKITTTIETYGLYAIVVLESSGQPISGPQRLMEIKTAIFKLLHSISKDNQNRLGLPYISRHVPRWYKYYQTNAKVDIYLSEDSQYSIIEVHAPDFPGLLARVGQVLVTHKLSIHSAKINTLGDKVIDFFYVTNKKDHKALSSKESIQALRSAIIQALR